VAQTQNGGAPPLPDEIAQRLAEQRQPRTVVPLDPKAFDQYVGYYQIESSLVFTITRDGDHFLSRLSGQRSVEIYPESSNKFFAMVVPAQLSFVTDAQGRATELVLHQGGFEQHAKRIDEAGNGISELSWSKDEFGGVQSANCGKRRRSFAPDAKTIGYTGGRPRPSREELSRTQEQ
jgi:Domain of unknown function (DUF3471)